MTEPTVDESSSSSSNLPTRASQSYEVKLRFRFVSCVALALFCDYLLLTLVVPILPSFFNDYNAIEISALFASKPFFQFFFNPIFGSLVGKYGSKMPLLIGVIVLALSTFVFAYAMSLEDHKGTSIVLCFVARSVQGIASASTMTAGMELVSETHHGTHYTHYAHYTHYTHDIQVNRCSMSRTTSASWQREGTEVNLRRYDRYGNIITGTHTALSSTHIRRSSESMEGSAQVDEAGLSTQQVSSTHIRRSGFCLPNLVHTAPNEEAIIAESMNSDTLCDGDGDDDDASGMGMIRMDITDQFKDVIREFGRVDVPLEVPLTYSSSSSPSPTVSASSSSLQETSTPPSIGDIAVERPSKKAALREALKAFVPPHTHTSTSASTKLSIPPAHPITPPKLKMPPEPDHVYVCHSPAVHDSVPNEV